MEQAHIDFDDLRAFFRVAETGSFARAAQRLESSKSLISRRVARLEETLSAQLLQRSARGALLTEAGQAYYEEARAAMAQLECAEQWHVHYGSFAIEPTCVEILGCPLCSVSDQKCCTMASDATCQKATSHVQLEMKEAAD